MLLLLALGRAEVERGGGEGGWRLRGDGGEGGREGELGEGWRLRGEGGREGEWGEGGG